MQSELLTPGAPIAREAFWFGPPGRRAFGFFHAPRGATRAMGIALCPSIGHEMLCTHRAYRHLAERLVARGFAVVRFDYHGTGDSPGTDDDDGRVAAWLGTIDDAIGVLREAGFLRVALFGTRLGATLAASAAARRGDVEALALVAPALSGASFLRELRAMQKVRDRGEERPRFRGQRPGDEEAIGFVFRKETISALERLDFRTLELKPAERALVVPRDDLPGREPRIVDRLRELGTDVEIAHARGYAGLAADDPYVAEVPSEIWSTVAGWFEARVPRSARMRTPRAIASTSVRVDETVTESVVRYGDGDRLFAILSEREGASPDVGVILANTGANPRVGPNRFSVTLARKLAARGHGVLRIDLAGIGDSPPKGDHAENDLYASHSIEDVRAAVDALAARGYRRFVAMGLCSGAYMSFHAALSDERIAGAVLMNPPVFEWTPGRKVERIPSRRPEAFRSMRYYKRRALHFDTWKRVLHGEVHGSAIAAAIAGRLARRAKGLVQRAAIRSGRGEWLMSDLARKFASLAQRDARVLLLFADDEPMLDEIEHHLGGLSKWLRAHGLEIAVIDDTDHVFAPVWSQERAADAVTGFVERLAKEKRK